MSINKLDGSQESTLSTKRVRWWTSFANFACCSCNWHGKITAAPTTTHILESTTTENDNKRQISVVGQSGSRFYTNMKKKNSKTFGYFLACSAVVMLKIELRPGCTRTKGYISRKQRRTKKVTSKLEQGLNFTVNGDFCFCNDDFSKQNPESKKRDFCRFSTTFKTVINLLLSKFRRWYFAKSTICIYSRYPYLKGILSNA